MAVWLKSERCWLWPLVGYAESLTRWKEAAWVRWLWGDLPTFLPHPLTLESHHSGSFGVLLWDSDSWELRPLPFLSMSPRLTSWPAWGAWRWAWARRLPPCLSEPAIRFEAASWGGCKSSSGRRPSSGPWPRRFRRCTQPSLVTNRSGHVHLGFKVGRENRDSRMVYRALHRLSSR